MNEAAAHLPTRLRQPILQVEALFKTFPVGDGFFRPRGELRAIDGVSFEVERGKTFGLVGESGCGKSTIARCILRLMDWTSGSITFDGVDMAGLDRRSLRRLRRRLQIVFQDSGGVLDTRMSVRALVEEPLVVHGIGNAGERREKVDAMLTLVGIRPELASRRPQSFSGGQRQRISLARALILDPSLVVLDEPISALDVSVQAQILNLLKDLQDRLSLTYVFIVHDLTVAEFFCDRVAVLYLGRVMEVADAGELFDNPRHPYTVSLLSAAPVPSVEPGAQRKRIVLKGEVSPIGSGPAEGCVFRPRCPIGRDRERCASERPDPRPVGPSHAAACHYPEEVGLLAAAR